MYHKILLPCNTIWMHLRDRGFIFERDNDLKHTVNVVKVYLDGKTHNQSWTDLSRVWTSTFLKQCWIILT